MLCFRVYDENTPSEDSDYQLFSYRRGANNQNGNLRCFFSMKGGGLEFHIPILKNDFLENHLESFPDCENVLHLVWALYYVYIVVEVTMNMA